MSDVGVPEAGRSADWRYESLGSFLLRVPLLGVEEFRILNQADDDAVQTATAALLARPGVLAALQVSAPDLASAVARLGTTAGPRRRDRRRVRALTRYLTRMSTRPTPYGLLATVSGSTFGPEPGVLAGASRIEVRARPDMGLVYTRTRSGYAQEPAQPGVEFWWNELATITGARAYLADRDLYGEGGRRGVRVRAGEPLLRVRAAARSGATFDNLVNELCSEVDESITVERVVAFVKGLVTERFLIPEGIPSPLGFDHDGEAVAESLGDFDPSAVRSAFRAGQGQYQGESMEVHAVRPFRGNGLPVSVGRRIADAATFLTRVCRGAGDASAERDGYLDAYHRDFLERFGLRHAVPIATVLDPVAGLGVPAHHMRGSTPLAGRRSPGSNTPYEQVLADILVRAWSCSSDQIDITGAIEGELVAKAPGPRTDARPQPSIDVFAQVGLDRHGEPGNIVLNAIPVGYGGASFGRFEHVLDATTRRELDVLHSHREGDPEVIVAEVEYVPSPARFANVATRPRRYPFRIPVNLPASGDDAIPLSDVLVVASPHRLMLWSRVHNCELVAVANHLLSPDAAPGVVRLMAEISERRFQPIGGFSWGPFEGSLSLPRVVRDGVVLRVREWTLTRVEIGDVVTRESLQAWRERWRVPHDVYIVRADQRLAIDLTTPRGVEEVAEALAAAPSVTIHEMLPRPHEAWLQDDDGRAYLSEVVVPVILAAPTSPTSKGKARTGSVVYSPTYEAEHADSWVYVKVYAPNDLQDLVLEALRGSDLACMDVSFFVRYADPRPHLRLRFAVGGSTTRGEIVERIERFCDGAVRAGLSSDWSWHRYFVEAGRYGGPDVVPYAEAQFAASSRLVLARLATPASDGSKSTRLGVAARDLDELARAWKIDPRTRAALSATYGGDTETVEHARLTYREAREELLAMFAAETSSPDLLELARATAALRDAAGSDDDYDLFVDVAHMHMNRLLRDDIAEREVYALWGLVLRGQAARRLHVERVGER